MTLVVDCTKLLCVLWWIKWHMFASKEIKEIKRWYVIAILNYVCMYCEFWLLIDKTNISTKRKWLQLYHNFLNFNKQIKFDALKCGHKRNIGLNWTNIIHFPYISLKSVFHVRFKFLQLAISREFFRFETILLHVPFRQKDWR